MIIKTFNGKVAYDELFHRGVNIIRGNNSSGKSTITHFIFYVLGGDFTDFVPEAKKCSEVYAEVEINGLVMTLKRELDVDEDMKIRRSLPMFIYLGNYENSKTPKANNTWKKYGYKTTSNRKSFSNMLFNSLDIPQVKGDSNITMHQILRLLYIDQNSPTSSLYYYENFDSQLTRETVSDLLLGVYDEALYDKKRRLIDVQRELDETKNEIKSIKKFFSSPLLLIPANILTKIEGREKEITKAVEDIRALRNEEKKIRFSKNVKLRYEKLHDDAVAKRNNIIKIKDDIDLLEASIEESEYFLETLDDKLRSIRVSIKTREFLGELELSYCPECLSSISVNVPNSQCKLCKEELNDQYGIIQAKKMEQELLFQIKESTTILSVDKKELELKNTKYKIQYESLRDLQKEVNLSLNDVKSVNSEAIDALRENKGFLEGEILQFRTLLESAMQYQGLLKHEGEQRQEVAILIDEISIREANQKKLKLKIEKKVKDQGLYLLNNDLLRQDEFKDAKGFHIDFSNNLAFLSNKYAKYSASSNFYLKVSARFALFLASLEIENMRFPRFIFADNMEDKGIEKERAQNLQILMIEKLKSYNKDNYQLIYTTSYITEELNNSDYVVGDFYTKTNKSLKNVN